MKNQKENKREMTTKIRIGIVGSRSYTDKKKIKDLIFEIKTKYGNEVEIVSGGQKEGADGYAKNTLLNLIWIMLSFHQSTILTTYIVSYLLNTLINHIM